MQNWTFRIILIIILLVPTQIEAQSIAQDSTRSKFFVGSTFFVLANLIPDDNAPDFVQLNLGYRFTEEDALSIELKTWKYAWPLGIPYGSGKEAPEERFPGYVREFGVAFAYQHFWWRGLYTGIHVMSAWQTFNDDEGQVIDNGYQIFNSYRIGYQFRFFRNRFFIEPSITVTHRPYHTEMPESFKQFDDKWSKFFYGEPGLHFGYNF